MRELRLTASAKADVSSAYGWYEERQVGLGESFSLSVQALLSTISRRPNGFPAVDDRFRRAVVRRFPFVIVYEFDARQVIVHALFHTSQNPSNLSGRLRGS